MQHSLPVVDILLAQRHVEAVGVASRLNISRGRAFAEHLNDGIAGHRVDEQEDDGDDEPDHRQRVQHPESEMADGAESE